MLHNNTQVCSVISGILAYVETQFGTKVKSIRSDNCIEFIQESCSDLLASKGIVHLKTIPSNPHQNVRVERKQKHMLETARAIRFHSGLPIRFWGDCLLAATHIINLLPSSVQD